MAGIWQDIRHGSRSLFKTPGFTVVAILILTVGIGANVSMFGVIDTALIRALPYPEPDRLVAARTTFEGRYRAWVSARDYWDYRDLATSFDQLAAYSGFPRQVTVTGVEQPERIPALVVSREFFPALAVRPAMGRGFASADQLSTAARVAVLSYGYWQRRLGGVQDVVGQTLSIDGALVEIIGVMPAGFHFRLDAEIWLPMREDDPFIAERGKTNWSVIGRLAPGVSIAQAQAEVDVISARLAEQYPDSNRGIGLGLINLQEAWSEDYRESLFMLQAAVALVLLIACGNVAGLLLARGSTRRGELSMRAALGASGGRIVRQLMIESLLLAGVAGVFGILLAGWLRPLLLQITLAEAAGGWSPDFHDSHSIRGGGFDLTGLAFGTLPALRASRNNPAQDLKRRSGRLMAVGRGSAVGWSSCKLRSPSSLVGAGLLIRSLASLMSEDWDLTGEAADGGDPIASGEYRTSSGGSSSTRPGERVAGVPGVESVGLISQIPVRQPGNNEPVYDVEDPPLGLVESRSAHFRAVLPGYFEAMRIPLHAGRDIQPTDAVGSQPVLSSIKHSPIRSSEAATRLAGGRARLRDQLRGRRRRR